MEDDFSRECVDIAVEHGMCGEYVATAGPARAGSGLLTSDPHRPGAGVHQSRVLGLRLPEMFGMHQRCGLPTQNAYIKSFNCKFRDECLN